jgi:hypothetical protein
MNPNIGQMAQQSYDLGQSMLSQDNANVAKYTGNYNTASQNANNAQNDLSNFTKNMQSGTDMYQKGLQVGNANAGYDVNNLNQAQNQVSQLTGIIGGLPRAIQASNANYGATAGQVANQVATTGANLNQSLGLANQNAANQIQKMQGGLTGAQAYTTSGLQGQQNQLTGYTNAAQNAVAIANQARQAMDSWATLAQQQGGLNASQQQAFAQAKQAYAQAAQAYAQVSYLNSQTQGQNLSNQQLQAQIDAKSAADTNAKIQANSKAMSNNAQAQMQFPGTSQPSKPTTIFNWADPFAQAAQNAGQGFRHFLGF